LVRFQIHRGFWRWLLQLGIIWWVARELIRGTRLPTFACSGTCPLPAGLCHAIVGFVMYGGPGHPLPLAANASWLSFHASGEAMLALGLGAAFAMPIASVLVTRFDPRKVCACGILGLTLTFIS